MSETSNAVGQRGAHGEEPSPAFQMTLQITTTEPEYIPLLKDLSIGILKLIDQTTQTTEPACGYTQLENAQPHRAEYRWDICLGHTKYGHLHIIGETILKDGKIHFRARLDAK